MISSNARTSIATARKAAPQLGKTVTLSRPLYLSLLVFRSPHHGVHP
jgi:hypothetical protein